MTLPDRPQQPDVRRSAAAAAAQAAAAGEGAVVPLAPTERFATRTAGMTASEIRALFAAGEPRSPACRTCTAPDRTWPSRRASSPGSCRHRCSIGP